MTSIGSLTADLKLESASFIAELQKSAQAVAKNTQSMTAQLGSLREGFLTVSKFAAGAFAGDFGLRAIDRIKDLVASSLDLAKTMGGPLAESAERAERDLNSFRSAFDFGVAQGFLEGLDSRLDVTQGSLDSLTLAGKDFGKAIGEGTAAAVQGIQTLLPYFDKIKTTTEVLALAASQQWAALAQMALNYSATLNSVDQNTTTVAEHFTQFNAAFRDLLAQGGGQQSFWQTTVTASEEWSQALRDLPAIIGSTETPLDKYKRTLADIALLQTNNKITAQQAAMAQQVAAQQAAQAARVAAATYYGDWAQAFGNVSSALQTAFADQKAFAIASAVISAIQGGLKTYAQYGFTPVGIALMASGAAMAAAQIATLKSVSAKASSGHVPSVSSGSGSAASSAPAAIQQPAAPAQPTQPAPTKAVNVTINGAFSPSVVRDMIDAINKEIADGATLNVTGAA